jgi:hypothetical protein
MGFSEAAQAKPGCRTKECDIRVARKACDRGEWRKCVLRAAIHRGQSYGEMLGVAWCESRFDRWAVSPGGHRGPFQFAMSTWFTTPYGHHSPHSWKWASLATAWAWQQGRKREWSCAR